MEEIKVIKIGGNVLNNEEKLHRFLSQFSLVDGLKLLIHGGGKLATQLADQMNVPVQLIDGRRITDDQMLDVVIMAYGGLVNRKLVAKLQKHGSKAIGLTGADGNILVSRKRPTVEELNYGWVGDPITCDGDRLLGWLREGLVPVIAPLTHDGKGQLLNTNADTMAQFIAVTLSKNVKVNLIYAFELKGVMEDISEENTVFKTLNATQYQSLKEKGTIHSGMIPKLDNAFEALNAGVSTVSLVKYSQISKIGKGNFDDYTRLYR